MNAVDTIEKLQVVSIRGETAEIATSSVSREVPLTINLNGEELATLLCSPKDLDDLVAGFLYASRLISDRSDIEHTVIDQQRWKADVRVSSVGPGGLTPFKRIYTSGCGKGIIFHNPLDLMHRRTNDSGLRIEAGAITSLMRSFLAASEEHGLTRGVHSSALATPEGISIFRDDLGRHNAVDKVLGRALQSGISLEDKLVLTSGRVSSDIAGKMIRCGTPVLVSSGAPTDQAVKMARQAGLTLVGLARGVRMNVYSGEQRITGSES
jgi:FdhD protein